MFNVGFNPSASQLNGLTTYVMNSSEETDQIINDFENAIAQGLNSDAALEFALKSNRIQMTDLTYSDRNRIEKKVEEIKKRSFYNERRY